MRAPLMVTLTTLAVVLAGCQVPQGGGDPDNVSLDPLLEDVPALVGLEWAEAPPMPRAMQDMACTVYEDELWVIGGINARSLPTSQVQVFDPEAGRWRTEVYLPTLSSSGVHGAAAVALQDRIQVVGGYESIGRTQATDKVYELRNVFWTETTPLPHKLAEASQVEFGEADLLWGGTQQGRMGHDGVLRYNEQVDSWTHFSTIPTARADAALSFQPGDAIYIIGGWGQDPHTPLANTTAYDFDSGDVQELDPVPVPRIGPSAGAWGDQMWIAGGLYNGTATKAVLVFDFDTRSWLQGPDLPVATAYGCAVELKDGIHVVGGTKPDGRGAINDHWVIRPIQKASADNGGTIPE